MALDLNKCSPQLRERILKQVRDEDHCRKTSSPDIERPVCDAPLEAQKGKGEDAGGVPERAKADVRITSFRRRLCDPDNLVGKYFLDCCRYAGLLRDDTAAEIDYRITQVKVKTKEEERTEIQISENQINT
jgi:hypothetical protein